MSYCTAGDPYAWGRCSCDRCYKPVPVSYPVTLTTLNPQPITLSDEDIERLAKAIAKAFAETPIAAEK